MNKKGFTLAEIIGVIVILGLVALLAFPPMLNMIKNSENKISDATKTLIYTASSQYTAKYINNFPKKEGNVYCITIEDLVKEEFLQSSIQNENLGDFGLKTKIKITINNDLKYDYIIDNNCIEVK